VSALYSPRVGSVSTHMAEKSHFRDCSMT